jgi:4-amino-4-deoxy-L-arabinose transferase-like glycosyltransferase
LPASYRSSTLLLGAFCLLIAFLYLYDLDGVGVFEPDEPRYSAIGQAMWRSRDFITPRLWGAPWFEKPPLLYWLTAAGTAAGFSVDLAGRVPVATASLLFLALYYLLLRREFGGVPAAFAAGMLGTCAGWLAYSNLCLTDIPLAICYGLAVILCLPLLRSVPDERHLPLRFAAVGACLGLGVLAKGLVPLVLALPMAWFLRRFWKQWWIALLTCIVVAAPWYVLMYTRNGYAFIEELFIRHHFQRLYSSALQHEQPWFFYLPVLLGMLFPWTPALFWLLVRPVRFDRREQFLLALAGFGALFFSLSLNKLPGYLLPLLPAIIAVSGARLADRPTIVQDRRWLVPIAALIAVLPLLTKIIPNALIAGRISFASLTELDWSIPIYCLIPFALAFVLKRVNVAPSLVVCAIAAEIFLKATVFPVLDQQVSSRGLWRKLQPVANQLCDAGANRSWIYGLSFYRGSFIHYCVEGGPPLAIRSKGHGQPDIGPLHPR